MYPEDRVLVAYVPDPQDFIQIRDEGWYRVPLQYAPKGLHAEYIAFYFGNKFGPQKWAIHYFARNLGHELTTRRMLIPNQPDHRRADDLYYKIQLSSLERRHDPIISLRWRRLTFIHTTWDRFQDATEINDLFVDGDPYVDRLYATLKDRGIQAERNYRIVREKVTAYSVPLAIPCRGGLIEVADEEVPENEDDVLLFAGELVRKAKMRGDVAQFPDAAVSGELERTDDGDD